MDRVLTENPPQIGAFRIRWEKAIEGMAIFADPTARFASELGGDAAAGEGDERIAARRRLMEACPSEATLESHVLDVVLARISELLRIPAEQLEPDASIGAMGVDSLTAIELGIHLRRSLGVDFTPIQLLAGPTPLGMRDHVMGALGADRDVTTGIDVTQTAPSDDPEQAPPRRPGPERASRRTQRPGEPPAQRHPDGRTPVPSMQAAPT
jgi:acyl carrier protein